MRVLRCEHQEVRKDSRSRRRELRALRFSLMRIFSAPGVRSRWPSPCLTSASHRPNINRKRRSRRRSSSLTSDRSERCNATQTLPPFAGWTGIHCMSLMGHTRGDHGGRDKLIGHPAARKFGITTRDRGSLAPEQDPWAREEDNPQLPTAKPIESRDIQ